jgi:nitrogen-specific signal transduction histidine kinase
MGLATLYAIVSQYGGCVTVTSEPGDTAFEILLPSSR